DRLLHHLGHLDAMKPALTLRETLRFWMALYRGGNAIEESAIEDTAIAVGVGQGLDLSSRALSAGQRRRAALARLILAPRPLWLLDEPTSALDRGGEALLGQLMREHLDRGGIILAATHQALPLAPTALLELGTAA